ncbi:N-acetyl-gamma-glutamyl-phosphate reductase [Clostridium fungisolvens]|uniref:N-acetyl-gamma-glutamyl-phosphate reductase n=1 Tax=Clostridium fungisolvens TaxID=1604897 RepID=A0A6V8SL44_9CLOT|nr:N-acetyl-gamma-glutamyl-phosphate reductase [Clostridium fungisolvens]GFP77620.1 N-acetyl-gamma-glutamyl-phosphate reductase [Clostridium fungisolvens]
MNKLRVGIIGATGYVGIELLRLLLTHNEVEVAAISSSSFEGKNITDIYPNLLGYTELKCENTDEVVEKSDLLFLALPHGLSEEIANTAIAKGKKVIDLGADFRLEDENEYEEWYGKKYLYGSLHEKSVYGLCEVNRELIKKSPIIANPGCFPTSIALALTPLLKHKLIKKDGIIIDSKSGVTGAGRGLSLTSHYPESNENISPYKVGGVHRHIPEIEQSLGKAYGEEIRIVFTPHLIPVNRGILSTIYCELNEEVSYEKAYDTLVEAYESEKFVNIVPKGQTASIKSVTLSNNCQISVHFDERANKLILCSVIDNMLKGAAGQAIQNMNIMMGYEENKGLEFLAPAF